MAGERNLEKLLANMSPSLNEGSYVFCTINDMKTLNAGDVLMMFREKEGTTIVIRKELADQLRLPYSFVASWITLTVHSALDAVGLTAAFSKALAEQGMSCNVVAAYYHDHIFVEKDSADKAMTVLSGLSDQQ